MISCLLFFQAGFAINGSFKGRVAYFYPQSHLLRDVYHHGGLEPQIEAAISVYNKLSVWANFSPFWRHGSSMGLNTPTSIQIYPLSAGLKYGFQVAKRTEFYLGVGPSFSWTILCDHSPYVQPRVVKTNWGVIGKSGIALHFDSGLFLDFFADYSYGKISPVVQEGVQSQSVNIGGLSAGLGLGVDF